MLSGLINLLNSLGLQQELVVKATFYPIACLTLIFAFLVVISRNIFHSAVYLAFTLIGVACVYLYLNAEFLAIIQVLIYVGAIVTLFIFAIMLTGDIDRRHAGTNIWRLLLSLLASLAVMFILIRTITAAGWHYSEAGAFVITLPQLGRSLMTEYILPFEVISLVSLAAIVGAIVIGKADKR